MGQEPGVGEEEQDSLHLGCRKVECLKPLETEASSGHLMYWLGKGYSPGQRGLPAMLKPRLVSLCWPCRN